jgi:hypothetical protein
LHRLKLCAPNPIPPNPIQNPKSKIQNRQCQVTDR